MPQSDDISKELIRLGITNTLTSFLDGLPGLAYIRDDQGRTIYINQAYERVFKVELKDVFLKPPSLWLGEEQAKQQAAQDRSVIDTGTPIVNTVSDTTPTGEARFWRVFRFPIECNGCRAVGGWIIDMTRDLLAAERLQAMEKQVERLRVLEDALDGIAQLNDDFEILYVNPRLARILNRLPSELYKLTLPDLVVTEDRPLLQAALDRLRHEGRAETECRFIASDREVTAWIKLIRDSSSKHFLFLQDTTLQREFQDQLEESMGMLRDAQLELAARQSELETANNRLEVLATTDGLTGLLNHRKLQEQLADSVAFALRYNHPFSVLMLDIDNFKQYNDAFGHPAGDEALRIFAAILSSQVRTNDVVARYGGEEFVILLPMADSAAAQSLAERIRGAVEVADWPHRNVTTSIGVATLRQDGNTADELLNHADQALYNAKRSGRNRVST